MKRTTLIALSTLFALGLAACDRPGSTDRSAQRSTDQSTTDKSSSNSKTSPTSPTPPTGTPPASKP